jgi:hypothetical protein
MKKPKPAPAPEKATPAPIEILPQVPWKGVYAFLVLMLALLAWFSIFRIGANYEFMPNEGFNSYFQQTATSGGKIYGQAPVFYYANYPPVSFHVVGILGRIFGDINVTGRWISVLAWLAIGLFIALIVERLTGARRCGVFSALCWLIWLAAFDTTRIGQNDPHLLGIAFSIAGFYAYVRDPESPTCLRVSAVLFALSLFTKQSLLAFPAGVAIDLFLTARKRLLVWLIPAAAVSVALLAFTFVVDGTYFLDHLSLPRTYSYSDLFTSTGQYLSFVQVAFVAALAWVLRRRGGPLVWAFALGHVLGLIAVGGNGAGVNHFFDGMIATAMICGLLLADLAQVTLSRPVAIVLVLVPAFLTSLLALPQHVFSDFARAENSIPAMVAEFERAVSFVRRQPGPALCENLLVCFEAGKPETVDALALDQSIKTGHLDEKRIVDLVAARQFGSIELEIAGTENIRPVARHRFTAGFMQQLLSQYRLGFRDSRHAIFIP